VDKNGKVLMSFLKTIGSRVLLDISSLQRSHHESTDILP
jgi:hypothetical protein